MIAALLAVAGSVAAFAGMVAFANEIAKRVDTQDEA